MIAAAGAFQCVCMIISFDDHDDGDDDDDDDNCWLLCMKERLFLLPFTTTLDYSMISLFSPLYSFKGKHCNLTSETI